MTRLLRLLTLSTISLGLLVSSTQLALAQTDKDSDLGPHHLHAQLLVSGGSAKATQMAGAPCREIHVTIDTYNAARPWDDPPDGTEAGAFAPLGHQDLGRSSTEMLNTYLEAIDSHTQFAHEDVHICTALHSDGWLATSESIVEIADSTDGVIIITTDGPRECDYGQILLTSASYRYMWTSSIRGWFYGYGTNRPLDQNLAIGDLAFTCVDIFDPPSDVARVAEAVPTTQVNSNPSIKGLTGLDTWLWYDFSDPASWSIGPLSATVSRYGTTWTLQAYAWVETVMWNPDCAGNCDYRGMASGFDASGYDYVIDFDDSALSPASSYEAGADSEGSAAFEHVYRQMGDTTISAATTWRGYYQLVSTAGGIGAPNTYDPVVVAADRTMPVVSVRSDLRIRPD